MLPPGYDYLDRLMPDTDVMAFSISAPAHRFRSIMLQNEDNKSQSSSRFNNKSRKKIYRSYYKYSSSLLHNNLSFDYFKNSSLFTLPKVIRDSRRIDLYPIRDDYYYNILDWCDDSDNLVIALRNRVFLHNPFTDDAQVILDANDSGMINAISVSDDNLLAISQESKLISFYDIGNHHHLPISYRPSSQSCCVKWMPGSSSTIYIGYSNGQVEILKVFKTHTILLGSIFEHRQQICGKYSSRHNGEHTENKTCSSNLKILIELAKNKFHVSFCILTSGIAFNADGSQVALGANDNIVTVWNLEGGEPAIRCKLEHKAAIKALAFCPWAPYILATGGGMHDKSIHLWHSNSGAVLRRCNVQAQITSIIWSTTFREMAVTFGYGVTSQNNWVAVYSLPSFRELMRAPMPASCYGGRALSAVWAPSFDSIFVVCSDNAIRAYKIWPKDEAGDRVIKCSSGISGSSLIDGLEGEEVFSSTLR